MKSLMTKILICIYFVAKFELLFRVATIILSNKIWCEELTSHCINSAYSWISADSLISPSEPTYLVKFCINPGPWRLSGLADEMLGDGICWFWCCWMRLRASSSILLETAALIESLGWNSDNSRRLVFEDEDVALSFPLPLCSLLNFDIIFWKK